MMAGDVELFATDPGLPASLDAEPAAQSGLAASSRAAQGEPGRDLVQFAMDLDAAGVEFYGADWCPACTEQKELFEDGGQFLPFTDVTAGGGDRVIDSQFENLNLTAYPTWVFPDGTRLEGVQTLETLSQRSGVTIPVNDDERPFFAPVGDLSVEIGSPLHVPIDGYDPEGGPLTVTVTVADPAIATARVLEGNRSWRLNMEGYGDMVFELFEDRADRPADRIIQLTQVGFYDDIEFHRVIDGFVIQGGDPTATGTGGSTLGNFDDQFHPELQHNRSGVLSYAKSSDDTNDSQFFITEGPTRNLDFNHSIFGQLVEGEDVREAISRQATGAGDKPTIPIRIDTASIFNDTENSIVLFTALSAGTTTATITITDEDGNSFSEVVTITTVAEGVVQGSNAQPFLADIPTPAAVANTGPATLQLASTDLEGDAVQYFAQASTGATATVDANGLVTVTPNAGFSGNVNVDVAVRSTVEGAPTDVQRVPFTFTSTETLPAPTSIDLRASSDTGSSPTDNITSATSLTFDIAGVRSGSTVEIINTATGNPVGQGTASGTTVSITTANLTTLGDGTYVLAARQRNAATTSTLSPTLTVTLDRASVPITIPAAAVRANAGSPYNIDLSSAAEGNGGRYALTTAPAGLTINPTTGVLSWTPTAAQIGSQAVTVQLTNSAGNVQSESFNVNVAAAAVAGVDLVLVDSAGNPVTSVDVGDRFTLQFFGTDERPLAGLSGVFAAFADVLFDPSLVRVVPGTGIIHTFEFSTLRKGTVGDGILNEIGAVSGSTRPSTEPRSLIATVQFEAVGAGTATFTAEEAEDSNSEVLLYFENDRIPATSTRYGTASVAIGPAAGSIVTVADTFTVNGATPQRLNVLANDTAPAGGTLTLSSVTQPAAGGTVAIDAGQVRFTPATGFAGTSTFTYTAAAASGATQTQNVTVTVNNADEAPSPVADTFTVAEDAAATTFDVLANDTADSAGQTFTITSVTQGSSGGAVTIAQNGTRIVYTPAPNFNGTETASYTIRDTGGGQATATLTFNVTAVNDAPSAVNRTATVLVSAVNAVVLRADSFANVDAGETLSFVNLSSVTGGGTASVSADGQTILFTPGADATAGTSTLTFRLRDAGGLESAAATLTIDVREFTPRDFIFNFNRMPTESELATLNFVGTDAAGQPVSMRLNSTIANRSGNQVTLADQLPGSYRLDIPDNPFFSNRSAGESLLIESGVDDGDASVSVELGTVGVEYLTMRRWFGSSPRRTVLAVVSPGESAVAMQTNAAVNDLANVGVDLDSTARNVTVRADRTNGTTTTALTGTAAIAPSGSTNGSVRQLAQIGGQRLVEINLDNNGVPLRTAPATTTPATTTPAGTGTTTVNGGGTTSALNAAVAPDNGRAQAEPTTRLRSSVAAGEPISTAKTVSAAAVDEAMADVLPALELRSAAAESMASGEPLETFAQSADRVFEGV